MSPQIGDDAEAASLGDAESGAARLEIATREQIGGVAPARQGCGRPRVELVAIARDDELPARMRAPGESEHAHYALFGRPPGQRVSGRKKVAISAIPMAPETYQKKAASIPAALKPSATDSAVPPKIAWLTA